MRGTGTDLIVADHSRSAHGQVYCLNTHPRSTDLPEAGRSAIMPVQRGSAWSQRDHPPRVLPRVLYLLIHAPSMAGPWYAVLL